MWQCLRWIIVNKAYFPSIQKPNYENISLFYFAIANNNRLHLTITPNPASQIIHLENVEGDIQEINIFNMQGVLMQHITFKNQ